MKKCMVVLLSVLCVASMGAKPSMQAKNVKFKVYNATKGPIAATVRIYDRQYFEQQALLGLCTIDAGQYAEWDVDFAVYRAALFYSPAMNNLVKTLKGGSDPYVFYEELSDQFPIYIIKDTTSKKGLTKSKDAPKKIHGKKPTKTNRCGSNY